MSDPRLRFRVWIGGSMVDETWIDCSVPANQLGRDYARVQRRHYELAVQCACEGRSFQTEIFDPDGALEPTGFRFTEPHEGKVFAAVGDNPPEELDQAALLVSIQQAAENVI